MLLREPARLLGEGLHCDGNGLNPVSGADRHPDLASHADLDTIAGTDR
jgi:hypothetical protein